jgi:hypothetical protein
MTDEKPAGVAQFLALSGHFAELRLLMSWAINCGLRCCQEAALLAEVVDGANLL